MTTLLQPEKDWNEMDPPSREERYELDKAQRALGDVCESLKTTLPDVLTALEKAKWDGEALCDLQSLAALAAQIEPLRTQLIAVLDPAYKEIHRRLDDSPSRGDGPAWE